MEKRALGKTGLEIAPLVFGGNVFGWTADEQTSFAVLDAFVDHGFNAIDTADVYSSWVPGNKGGESETIIGKWLKANPAKRDQVVLFTKVGSDMGVPSHKGLSQRWIADAAEDSLKRLQTDHIDLYFSHWPDPDTPYEETLGAYQTLLEAGKIKSVGASNLDASQLQEALKVSEAKGLPRYQVLQPEYNLYDRSKFDGPLRDLCMREGLGVVTYFSLASGFLSGKYRSKDDLKKSKRGEGVGKYLDDRGLKILDALDQVSESHNAEPAEVALAWIIARPGLTAPIASATSVDQVESFAKAASLKLSQDDIAALDKAST
ncbi:aldo/keto reductase [Tianweitania populi]|uniref:NADP-dependent aryl-alcohol dehydrogenase n=1 Tax=Tianweitania populi TaxID=1607949 RepID=A0A8J3DQQ2_9HYPH|nr:aldo/keto reductase [Tianweitania populi]GHD16009.1 NADP-dependent aryl-alcohol dehydrogenase [Tianweitania populi]